MSRTHRLELDDQTLREWDAVVTADAPRLGVGELEFVVLPDGTLVYSAYVSEVYRAGIESIHPSQEAAARSLGLSHLQAMRYVVIPQAIRRVIPPLLNDFIGLQKDTVLAHGTVDLDQVKSRMPQGAGLLALLSGTVPVELRGRLWSAEGTGRVEVEQATVAGISAGQGMLDWYTGAAGSYFTNLTSDPSCPADLKLQARFAYGDALMSVDAADSVITAYRNSDSVYENDWKNARTDLARALAVDPDDTVRGKSILLPIRTYGTLPALDSSSSTQFGR